MVTREEVIERTKKIIRDCVPDAFDAELTEDTILNAQGNVDSMGYILVLTKLEGAFGVTLPETEWDTLRTLGDVADAVMRRLPEE